MKPRPVSKVVGAEVGEATVTADRVRAGDDHVDQSKRQAEERDD